MSCSATAWAHTPGFRTEGAGFGFVGEEYRLDEGIGIAVRHEDASLERINARYFPFSIY